MNRLYRMTFRLMVVSMLIGCGSLNGFGQSETPPKKDHRFVGYIGIGPNYYFNNLVVGKNGVNELNYSISGRIMWEPTSLLSLGIETGYFLLYTANYEKGANTVHISNAIVPIHIVVSMKFFKNYYGSFSLGQSILFNNVNTSNSGRFDAATLSLGDFGAAVGYRKQLNEKVSLGVEMKGYSSSKLDDHNIALLFMVGYTF